MDGQDREQGWAAGVQEGWLNKGPERGVDMGWELGVQGQGDLREWAGIWETLEGWGGNLGARFQKILEL